MCRVPLSALSHAPNLDVPLQRGHYVDLSSQAAQRPYFAAWSQENDVQPLLMHLGHAEKVREVLVAWRGELDPSPVQVIDATTGEFLHMLDAQARCCLRATRVGKQRISIAFRVLYVRPLFIPPPPPPFPHLLSPYPIHRCQHSSLIMGSLHFPSPPSLSPSMGADSIPMRMAMCLEVFRAVCGFDS